MYKYPHVKSYINLVWLCLLYGSLKSFQPGLFSQVFFIILPGKELPGINQNQAVDNDKSYHEELFLLEIPGGKTKID